MVLHVLAIAGSPRRHGNSETLLDWVIAAMQAEGGAGIKVEKVALNEVTVEPCRGCNACEQLNRCVQRDDLDWLGQKLLDADCVMLAAPIYCMGVCAQAKALIDRAQVFRSRKYVLHLPVVPPERKGKRLGVFLSTAGQTWEHVFDAAVPAVKCFYHVMEIKNADISYLMVKGVDHAGEVEEHPSAAADAAALGKDLVRELRRRFGDDC
ncbi:flavodoxin family protein [Methanofollis formosanus]|uniref:Flavodoxin family protein n=1 Tax=Methanofollis formosanus TaxID=299308 RepID=A0A8G1EG74_9EURY|nr:flavodoxin family protein [Methanofollis formosanus]QYZ79543.1 flavodoxin family protein [Methanofollis formosanus]